jgi:hypothetical protein
VIMRRRRHRFYGPQKPRNRFRSSAMAGFLLTAMLSWTGQKGSAGRPLIILEVTPQCLDGAIEVARGLKDRRHHLWKGKS